MQPIRKDTDAPAVLSAQDLLAGSTLIHQITIPEAVLRPLASRAAPSAPATIRLRPLSVGTLALISRAAHEDASLIPLLMIKEAVVEPLLTLDQIRQLHVGLVHFLVGRINQVSGLDAEGQSYDDSIASPAVRAHVLLARHFGWTPEQVAQLTPAQVMVYLAGIEKLLAFEEARKPPSP
jgi:hypothetical protein